MALAAPSTEQLQRLLSSRVHVRRRVEIYEADQATLWMNSDQFGPLEGTVSVDASRDERRTLEFHFEPLDTELRIGVGKLWYDKIVRPYWGFYDTYQDNDSIWEIPLGDYMIDQIEDGYFPSTIRISGRDVTKKLLTSMFTRPLSFAAGTRVDTIIVSLAGNAGITNIIMPWNASSNPPPTLPIAMTFDADSSRFAALESMLIGLGYEIFFDAYSRLVVRLFQDPATLAPVLTFKTGEPDGNLIQVTRRSNDSELYNHVVVRGSGSANATVYASVEVEDESSPVHKDKIGERVWSYPTPSTGTSEEALLIARTFLQVKSLEAYEVDFGAISAPWLEGGDVVGYDDPNPAINEPTNFFLSSFTIPLALGGMSGTFKRVVSAV